jgi:tetratricopeptide (TPR) repeat protein
MSGNSMNRITSIFLFFSVALIIWSVSAGVSSFLGGGFIREQAARRGTVDPHAEHEHEHDHEHDSPELTSLREKAAREPGSVEANLNLGFALMRTAHTSRDGSIVMEAAQSFKKVLAIAPDNAKALLGMASLCLQNGIFDKALEYYPRYLRVKPDDLNAKADLALVHFEIGQFEAGEKVASEILAKDPKFFPGNMVMAIGYKMKPDLKLAKQYALKAREDAPNDRAIKDIDSLIQSLSSPAPTTASNPLKPQPKLAAAPGSSQDISPASRIEQFFKDHQIIGPALVSTSWVSSNTVDIRLKDFPVEKMPPFAKQAFIGKTKAKLADLPEQIEMRLVDDATGQEMLSIPVGTTNEAQANSKS